MEEPVKVITITTFEVIAVVEPVVIIDYEEDIIVVPVSVVVFVVFVR